MMVEFLRDLAVVFFLLSGTFFFLVGVIGLLRMPDVFTRMHATTKCDTMGAGLIFLGLILWKGFTLVSLVVFLVLLFLWITNPTAAHYIAKGAYESLNAKDQKEETKP
jgi:multicomponent Na+:H+ antiporter subunit G